MGYILRNCVYTIWLLFFSSAVMGQAFSPGVIITTEGDSVRGFMNYHHSPSSFERLEFQGMDGTRSTYLPGQINGYKLASGALFLTKTIEGNEVFVDVLLGGEVSLFKYKENFAIEKDGQTYLLINTIKEVEISSPSVDNPNRVTRGYKEMKEYVGVLIYLLQDCSSSDVRPSNAVLRQGSLVKLLRRYNQCLGSASKLYEKIPRVDVMFGFRFNPYHSNLTVATNSFFGQFTGDEIPRKGFSLGPLVDFSPRRLRKRLSFLSGFTYSREYFIDDALRGSPVSDKYLNYSKLSVPVLVQFEMPRYSIKIKKILVYAGFTGGLMLGDDVNKMVELIDSQFELTAETHFSGWQAGIGIELPFLIYETTTLHLTMEKTSSILKDGEIPGVLYGVSWAFLF